MTPKTPTPQGISADVIHQCPQDGDGGLMPCCGLTPFEVPRTDRMTLDPALVTCSPLTPKDGD
jgi:hypothetical protein